MIYIAHLDIYDEMNNEDVSDRIIFTAESYQDAINTIFSEYNDSNVNRITLLEPIGYGDIIFMDEDTEDGIRSHAYNSF